MLDIEGEEEEGHGPFCSWKDFARYGFRHNWVKTIEKFASEKS